MTEESYYWNMCVNKTASRSQKRSCRRKPWISQHDHNEQGDYKNSVRELKLYKVT